MHNKNKTAISIARVEWHRGEDLNFSWTEEP